MSLGVTVFVLHGTAIQGSVSGRVVTSVNRRIAMIMPRVVTVMIVRVPRVVVRHGFESR